MRPIVPHGNHVPQSISHEESLKSHVEEDGETGRVVLSISSPSSPHGAAAPSLSSQTQQQAESQRRDVFTQQPPNLQSSHTQTLRAHAPTAAQAAPPNPSAVPSANAPPQCRHSPRLALQTNLQAEKPVTRRPVPPHHLLSNLQHLKTVRFAPAPARDQEVQGQQAPTKAPTLTDVPPSTRPYHLQDWIDPTNAPCKVRTKPASGLRENVIVSLMEEIDPDELMITFVSPPKAKTPGPAYLDLFTTEPQPSSQLFIMEKKNCELKTRGPLTPLEREKKTKRQVIRQIQIQGVSGKLQEKWFREQEETEQVQREDLKLWEEQVEAEQAQREKEKQRRERHEVERARRMVEDLAREREAQSKKERQRLEQQQAQHNQLMLQQQQQQRQQASRATAAILRAGGCSGYVNPLLQKIRDTPLVRYYSFDDTGDTPAESFNALRAMKREESLAVAAAAATALQQQPKRAFDELDMPLPVLKRPRRDESPFATAAAQASVQIFTDPAVPTPAQRPSERGGKWAPSMPPEDQCASLHPVVAVAVVVKPDNMFTPMSYTRGSNYTLHMSPPPAAAARPTRPIRAAAVAGAAAFAAAVVAAAAADKADMMEDEMMLSSDDMPAAEQTAVAVDPDISRRWPNAVCAKQQKVASAQQQNATDSQQQNAACVSQQSGWDSPAVPLLVENVAKECSSGGDCGFGSGPIVTGGAIHTRDGAVQQAQQGLHGEHSQQQGQQFRMQLD